MIGDADVLDVVWLAGLLEGEGAFDLQRGRYPRVRLAMTDRDVVGRAAALFGATVRLTLRPAPSTPIWHAETQGPRAVEVMRAVLPYMGARRSGKIAAILSEHARDSIGSGAAYGRPLSPS